MVGGALKTGVSLGGHLAIFDWPVLGMRACTAALALCRTQTLTVYERRKRGSRAEREKRSKASIAETHLSDAKA